MRQATWKHGWWRQGWVLLLVVLAGCALQTAREVQLRYAGERWIHRADLKRAQTYGRSDKEARVLWHDVAWFYSNALEKLPALKGRYD